MPAETKPQLTVIDGGREPTAEWLEFPTVAAPSPFDPNEVVVYRVAGEDARKAACAGRRQLVFDLWSMVIGEPPPIPNVESYNRRIKGPLSCLAEARACFRGIKRPLAEDNDGDGMLAYVTRPSFHYASQINMACLAKKQAVPGDVVFVIYVRLDQPFLDGSPLIKGIITHWQFVEAELGDRAAPAADRFEWLPIDYKTRYGERLW